MIPKFRAWNGKRMIYTETYPHRRLMVSFSSGKPMLDGEPQHDWTLMQSTGLKDKNGKEIFEGDILQSPYDGARLWVEYQAPAFVMRFNNKAGKKSGRWVVFTFHHEEKQFHEIIGNIHQNPELLAGEEQSTA